MWAQDLSNSSFFKSNRSYYTPTTKINNPGKNRLPGEMCILSQLQFISLNFKKISLFSLKIQLFPFKFMEILQYFFDFPLFFSCFIVFLIILWKFRFPKILSKKVVLLMFFHYKPPFFQASTFSQNQSIQCNLQLNIFFFFHSKVMTFKIRTFVTCIFFNN